MTLPDLEIRPARDGDLDRLQVIRHEAFAPVFASFRAILGDPIHSVAQARTDEEQAAYLESLHEPGSPWELLVAETTGGVVGFVSLRMDDEASVGEIGLNAVHPSFAGRGIGTAMYTFVLGRMRAAGIQIATVSTGADPSHAPARRAYAKAGFTVGIPSIWLCCDLR